MAKGSVARFPGKVKMQKHKVKTVIIEAIRYRDQSPFAVSAPLFLLPCLVFRQQTKHVLPSDNGFRPYRIVGSCQVAVVAKDESNRRVPRLK